MLTIRAAVVTRSGRVGSNPPERTLGMFEGTRQAMPAKELRELLDELLVTASGVAFEGNVTEITVTIGPAEIPSMN